MGPDEFLRDGTFGNFTEILEVWSLLEVYVEAVSEAVMLFANESILVNSEWEFWLSTTGLEALKRGETDLLCKS